MKSYKIKYKEDDKIKYLTISSDNLQQEKLPSNILNIKELKSFDFDNIFSKKKIKTKDLNLIFYELNMMLNSGLDLNTSLNILIKNKKDNNLKIFLEEFKKSLINKDKLDLIFEEYEVASIIKSFWKLILKSGNINSNIIALNTLLKENDELKSVFKKAIRYPLFLMISFFLSMITIFSFVIPKFTSLFEQYKDNLPFATELLLKVQFFFENYFLYFLFVFFILCFFMYFLYTKNFGFRYKFDKCLFLYFTKNYELYKFFLIMDIMLKNKYEFYKSLEYSKIIIENKFLLEQINMIEKSLKMGKQISFSFSKLDVFDDMVLNLINTAEVSNSLEVCMGELKSIYKQRFKEKINFIVSLIEPVFLSTIMLLIVWIFLAIFIPIWNMQELMRG